jgi:acyl carrier protein
MTMNIEKTLRDYLHTVALNPEAVSRLGLEDSLFTSGIVDSLGLLSLVVFVETTFGIKVPQADIKRSNFGSLKPLISYIEARQSPA